MAKTRKRYDDDFKEMIVDLYKSGKSAADLAKEFDIYEGAVYRWSKDFEVIHQDQDQSYTNKDMINLKKEMKKLEKENAILKDALAIFAKK